MKLKISLIKKIITLTTISTLSTFFLLLGTAPAGAIVMSNSNYLLDSDLNSGGGRGTSTNYSVGVSIGQIAPGHYSGTNYNALMGFQYLYPNNLASSSATIDTAFKFTISNNLIDFGILTPTNPVVRTNVLSVFTGSSPGFILTNREDQEFSSPSSSSPVPDVTCDNGLCTRQSAQPWTSTLTYGFGYRCDNVTQLACDVDFSSSNNYRRFANNAKGEIDTSFMSGIGTGATWSSQINYKVNISGTQGAGVYGNGITFIATSGY